MKRLTFNNLLSIAIVGSLIVGCGSDTTKKTTSTVGKVVDDYIAGATVCADINGNGLADDDPKNCVKTNQQGSFRFSTLRKEALVVSGGVDIGTGKAFKGVLSAPAGSSVVNPLTTLIHSVQKEGNSSVQEAQDIVKEQLGLSHTDVDLTSFDPLSELQFGEDDKNKEVAQKVLAQQTTVQVILSVTTTTIAATSDNVSEANISVEASNQMAQLMLSQINSPTATPKINDKETIETIIKETAQETFSENTQEHTEALASITKVQTVVAQQTQVVAQTVVKNIESIQADTTESALNVIKESNTAMLLVTDRQSDDSITNIIEEAVTTGETQTLASVDINREIKNSQSNLITRPEVIEEILEEIKIRPTGGEGGTL